MYTMTIAGETTTVTAAESYAAALRAQDQGVPYDVHDDQGRCVSAGGGSGVQVDAEAAEEWADAADED